jgi:hypothetical protein
MAHDLTPEALVLYWLVKNGYKMVGRGDFDENVAHRAQEAGLTPYKAELGDMMLRVLPILVMGDEGEHAPQDAFIAILRSNTEIRGESHAPALINDIFLGWNAYLEAD